MKSAKEPNTKPKAASATPAAKDRAKRSATKANTDEAEGSRDENTLQRHGKGQAEIVIPYKTSLIKHTNAVLYDHGARHLHHESQIRKQVAQTAFKRLHINGSARFNRRLTEISWHPKESLLVAAGCKFGDILLMKGAYAGDGELKFNQRFAVKGRGAGGAIFAIRFEENRRNMMYTAGLEGIVNSWDIERRAVTREFYSTGDYNVWFTSMDVSQATRTLLAGSTKGIVYISTLDGEKVSETRLHKGKVLHCEFNQSAPHMIVTSSIDKTVKLWDLRKMTEKDPLETFLHEKPVNVARFNPLNSSRLLTSDQMDEIRVYQGPIWSQITSIHHPHRQFQHLSAVVANWHPLSDTIVIGKYPKVPLKDAAPPRPIQFFDADTGNLIHNLSPPVNGIVSLNCFNSTGDVLASAQGLSLLFFNPQDQSKALTKTSEDLKRKIHFDGSSRGGRGSDSDDDDDDEDANQKPSRKKARASSTAAAKKNSSGKSSKQGKKK